MSGGVGEAKETGDERTAMTSEEVEKLRPSVRKLVLMCCLVIVVKAIKRYLGLTTTG